MFLPLIPSWVISFISALCGILCVYSYIKHRDTLGGGFAFAMFFFAAVYGYWTTADVEITVRQVIVRLGILQLVILIMIWRIAEIRSHRGA